MNKFSLKLKKYTSLMLVMLLIMSIFVGCSKKEDKVEEDVNKEEVKVDAEDDEGGTRIITDMAGREVEIPSKVEKVYGTGRVATIAIYTINPEKLVGINSEPNEEEKEFTTEEYLNLPVLGSYKGLDSGNEEEILNANPDLIISLGDINDRWIAEADEGQEKLGIPYIMVDGDLENLDKSYEFLGDILGEEDRAKELAKYTLDTMSEVKDIADTIDEDEKVKVYYSSPRGALVTNVSGSIHTQAIDLVGAKNVAEVEVDKISGGVDVSMEEVLNWNPELIIAGQGFTDEENSYKEIITNEDWKNIKAVEDGKVYAIPTAPFSWFDAPPSVNRIIGVKWAANLIYPDKFNYDMKKEAKEFYELFYHKELTDSEVDKIMENAVLK